ncbi:DUF4197 domain-containing protein [Sphingomonas lenta]|uniref:DUF4197 domain-containing protein n=1 Tax=Sphingomonas lenta TaxID=1141887 RepID=A0A2A2SH91_9SPHN|nr:DUF4197 domain-containing protein [Sphingomonas lenta]PAX08540.1 hypothetical protein CKY28_03955 [Sphingomonas lenta]
MSLNRRHILSAALAWPIAACTGPVGTYSIEEGVRRLLELSSQRAFARLLRPGGFYDDQLLRIDPPVAQPGSTDVLGAILRTGAVRRQVAIALNEVAVDAADRAAPIVTDAIRRMSFADALSIVRGGPTAATDLLAAEVGNQLIEAMYPEFSTGLSSDLAEIASAAVAARTGVDYRVLARDLSRLASLSIFRAIGREEAKIRANPAAVRDPAIRALFG